MKRVQRSHKQKVGYTAENILSYAFHAGLTSRKRKQKLVDSRYYLFYILYYEFDYSYQKIADCFNMVNHTSAKHGIDVLGDAMLSVDFLKNTVAVRQRFKYTFTFSDKLPRKRLQLDLASSTFDKLLVIQKRLGAKDPLSAINLLIRNHKAEWI